MPPRALRRALLPITVTVLLSVMLLLSLIAVIGLLASPFGHRRRLLRLALFGIVYVAMELVVLAASGVLWIRETLRRPWHSRDETDWREAHGALLGWALNLVLSAGRRSLGFQVVITGPTSPDPLGSAGPVLVLARHGGPGDSFALVHLLTGHYHRNVRVVLKDILQFDPALDVLLNRLGCCFLPAPRSTGEDLSGRLAVLAGKLGPGDALLLFPEGGNWTPTRRRRAIRHLQEEGRSQAAKAASLMDNVLPPRPGGVLACLEARPDLDVVMVAHAGLDQVVRAKQLWQQIPLTTPMTVRVWPAAVPPADSTRLDWLTAEWAVVDEWIDAFANSQT